MNQDQEVIDFVNETFENGHTLLRINQKTGEERVKLELEKELLPYSYKTVHLLSPLPYHERSLVFIYVQELVDLLPRIREEGIIDSSLLNVVESLLLALDYLTHERFTYTSFEEKHRDYVRKIFAELFSKHKSLGFSEYANRPTLNKCDWIHNEDELYCLDRREEKTRIYMAVFYKKPKNMMEHFKHVGHWLSKINLKPNTTPDKVSYEEMLEGKTDHDLHVDTLFYLGMVQRTFSWLLNSSSWRSNELFHYDEIELRCKLGIR